MAKARQVKDEAIDDLIARQVGYPTPLYDPEIPIKGPRLTRFYYFQALIWAKYDVTPKIRKTDLAKLFLLFKSIKLTDMQPFLWLFGPTQSPKS